MRFTLLTLFILTSLNLLSQTRNLQECIDYALYHRVEIQIHTNKIILSEHNKKYSKFNLLPSVDFEANHNFIGAKDFLTKDGEYSTNQTGNYSLNSQLIVFDGMQSILKIKQSVLLIERSKTEIEILKQEIKKEVIQAYFELLVAKENKRIIENSLDNIKKQEQIIQDMVSEGKVSPIDLYEIRSKQTEGKKNLLQAELNIKNAFILIKKTLNYPIKSDLEIDESNEINKSLSNLLFNDVLKIVNEALPQIKLAKQDSVYAKNNISNTKGQYLPYLTTSASIYSSFSENANNPANISSYKFDNQFADNISHQIGLSLVIPIYNRHSIKQKVFECEIQYDNSILEIEIIKKKIYREVESLIETIKIQKNKISILEEELYLNTQIFNMRSEQYLSGVLSINDYLLAENKKVNTELEINIEKYTLELNNQLISLFSNRTITQ